MPTHILPPRHARNPAAPSHITTWPPAAIRFTCCDGCPNRQKPAPQPKIVAIEVKKHGKDKGESASAGEVAARGEQQRSLAPKSRPSGIEVKKYGDGKAETANGGEDRRAARR